MRDHSDSPATALITREVYPGREPDYDDWSRRFLHAVGRVAGYQGATFVGPPHKEPGRRMLILRFADKASLRRWVDSEQRKTLTAESDAFSRHVYEEPSSLETWFTIPGLGAVSPPPRWKMALVTLGAIVPLVLLMNLTVLPLLSGWPLVARTLVFSGTLTGLMTWVVMPRMTRLLHRWLYPGRRP